MYILYIFVLFVDIFVYMFLRLYILKSSTGYMIV